MVIKKSFYSWPTFGLSRFFLLLFLTIIFLWTNKCIGMSSKHNHHRRHHGDHHLDFRIIHHDELMKDSNVFSAEGIQTFSQLLLDVPRYQVIVGARDHLLRLSLDGLHQLQDTEWTSTEATIERCELKGQSKDNCHNFIMVLLTFNNTIFTCGTNAFNPVCSWRQMDNLDSFPSIVPGVGMCPFGPNQNITALLTSQTGDTYDYYIGTTVDFSTRDPAIYRIMGNSPMLRTNQYNSKWLNEPNFVGSFEVDQYIYFFFRETATEFINCGKIIYSRIARVCKNDKGGQYMLKDNWTTFLKARLNCSVPGEYPFYYNEIQSVFYLEEEQTFYATFTTGSNSIYGSAICSFNMKAIDKAFDGAFKYQSSPSSAWERVRSTSHRQHQCEPQTSENRHLATDKYQLMDEAVQPTHPAPIFTEEDERYSHIVVDVVATKIHDRVHVLYVATTDGQVKKFIIQPRTLETCLVEVLNVFSKHHVHPIRQMKYHKELNSLYLGTEISVLKIPFSRCDRFKTKRTCLDAMDPYCGWNSVTDRCTTPPNKNPLDENWEQSVISCPVLTNPVNGGWSSWNKWSPCPQSSSMLDGHNDHQNCLCRSRQCDDPSTAYGGNDCEGPTYEVTNCTRNGQWTEWSSWSSCSQTCGMAVRTRKRTCGNPEPAFGGKPCNGSDRSEIYCASNPPCPTLLLPPIDGQWSEWSAWDECSAPCNRGMQARRRRCDNPPPQNGGRECDGCNVEYQDCNRQSCQEERRSSHWTPWLIHNVTQEGHFQQRFRFVCRAHVPDSRMIRVGPIKSEERFCTADGANCFDKAYIGNDGDWSDWSTWSPCTTSCGGGSQQRTRACDNPRPSGGGANCMGETKEERACNLQPCPDAEDEINWTSWSACDENHYQHRHSKCPPGISPPCIGSKEESRPCDYPDDAPRYMTAGVTNESGVGIGSMVLGCLLCFLLGAVLGFVALHVYNTKRRGARRHSHLYRTGSKKNNTYQPAPVKNNHYPTGSLKRNQTSVEYGPKRTNRTSQCNVVSEQDKYG